MERNEKNIVNLLKTSEDVVISGIGGRFPESDSMDEFANNLYNKVDMITADDRRWPTDLYDMNARMGKLKAVNKFDGAFFGIMSIIADTVDPQSRILLETTYEAILDSGINPQTLRGTKTGVYVGYSTIGMPEGIPQEVQHDSRTSLSDAMLWTQGTAKSMYANRVSFIFDFRGPSFTIDTACSSSMVALDLAVTDLRLGKCEQAVVAGVNLNLQPYTNHIYQMVHFNSPTGESRVWDQDADGFVRGETIACLFLQRQSHAKRIYATVIHSRTNIDGYKKMGMFFPSSDCQMDLMVETYKEAGVNPLDVTYFEAHGTATKVGDFQEARAIYNAYCIGRNGTLPIGLLKSNVGHGEGASGVASIIKLIISYENGRIAANLNLKKLKKEIAELVPPLFPVNDNLPYTPGIAGVNSFGVGGVNGHALLKPNGKQLDDHSLKIADRIPRLVNLCARTEESLQRLFNFVETNRNRVTRDFLRLINDTVKQTPTLNSTGFPYRGSILIKEIVGDDEAVDYEYRRQSSLCTGNGTKPVWFFFSGIGGQWPAMAKSLMKIDIFANKFGECREILKQCDIDLNELLLSDDNHLLSNITNKFVATTALQIALVEIMRALDIVPDAIVGHSFGEIACAYADECLTAEQALLVSYWRGKVMENNSKIPKGLMAAVGHSWDEMRKMCPKGVYAVCHNSRDLVTISGSYDETKKFIKTLADSNTFVREIDSSFMPLHTPFLKSTEKKLTEILRKVIPSPKLRSSKWISTSATDSKGDDNRSKHASAEYFVDNLLNPVLFDRALQTAPKDAIIIEIAGHSLFETVIKKSLESVHYIGLLKRNQNPTNLDHFLESIGKLYELGVNPSIENLYPKVDWPVARSTQSISSLLEWDHKDNYFVKQYPDHHFQATASDMHFSFLLSKAEHKFLADHCIDGRVILPATGYMMLAWRRLAAHLGRQWNKIPVVFENVNFRRPIFLSDREETKLTVRYLHPTGEFVVLEGSNVACFGRIYSPEENCLHMQHLLYTSCDESADMNNNDDSEKDGQTMVFDNNDVYRETRVRGYDYGPKFRGIDEIRNKGLFRANGKIRWTGTWEAFVDSMLQFSITALPIRSVFIPVILPSLRCDPNLFFEAIDENKQVIYDERYVDLEDRADEIKRSADIDVDLRAGDDPDDQLADESVREQLRSELEHFDQLNGGDDKKFVSVLPVFADYHLNCVVAKGVELRGWTISPIPRKPVVQGLNLESYEFVANEESAAIQDAYKKEVVDYIQVCCTLASKLLKFFGLSEHEVMNGYKKADDSVVDEYFKQDKDNHVMLKMLSTALKTLIEKSEELNGMSKARNKSLVLSALEESVTKLDIVRDVLYEASQNERLIRPLVDLVYENFCAKREVKVAEISLCGAFVAHEVDDYLAKGHIISVKVDYTVVHNSGESAESLEELRTKSFKMVEWEPESSSFPEGVSNAELLIHRDDPRVWTINLSGYMREMYTTLVENGFLLAVFRYKLTSPEKALNCIIDDNQISDHSLANRIETFETEAVKCGFSVVCRKYDSIGSFAVLFRKVNRQTKATNNETVIEIVSDKYEEWLDSLKETIADHNEANKAGKNIWLFAKDSPTNGIIGLTLCLRQESGGDKIRCIFDCDRALPYPPDFSRKPYSDLLANKLAVNVYRDGQWGTFRHLNLAKNYDQIETDSFYFNAGQRGDISSLQWYDSSRLKQTETFITRENERIEQVRCDIYYAGINFRDVMLASGRVMPGPESILLDCIIGTDFVGRRSDTGERVIGNTIGCSIGSSYMVRKDLLMTLPDQWSMEEASTVMNAYLTVWYGLIDRANLRRGESILIHSGCGGVGQAAINVCKYYDCKVFVTVGSDEKRQFLIDKYGLPSNRIFSSRDTGFEEKVMLATRGRGVDLVLNSLVGDKLQASLRCVAEDGRFVEIGKYDLQMNKVLGMFAFLKNLAFHGVNIERPLYIGGEIISRYFDWLKEGAVKGYVKPINATVFPANEAEQAFRYMTTGKHIGKVVIKIRDEEREKLTLSVKPVRLMATTKTFLDPTKVYIIIGGLGGVGLELTHWMIYRGAKKIVLSSRAGIRTNYQRIMIQRIEEVGKVFAMMRVDIRVATHSVAELAGAKALLDECASFGPIGGVFHLAVVLNDALIQNQSVHTFRQTCDSKVKACLNMDALTRELCPRLDYFVMFSSVSCGRGNAGQTNYGYANSVLERVCEARRRDGFHGLAVQYGPIADVGLLADNELTAFTGILQQRIASCLLVFDKFLQCNSSAVLSSLVRANRKSQTGTLEDNLVGQLWAALGVDPKTLPNHVTLGELGMESIFAVEFQQSLEREYDIKLSLSDVKKITVREMKEFQSGNRDKVKRISEEIKCARANFVKLRFVIPDECYARLNDVRDGSPVYILPPIEGMFDTMAELVRQIRRPVIGLNMTRETASMKTIKELTAYYSALLTKLSPAGGCELIGYSFGAVIAANLVRKSFPISKLVIIDAFSNNNQTIETEDDFFEPMKLFITRNLPEIFHERLNREMNSVNSSDEKLKKLTTEMREFGGKALVDNDLDSIVRNIIERAKLIFTYRRKIMNKAKKLSENMQKKFLKTKTKILFVKGVTDESSPDETLAQLCLQYHIHPRAIEKKLDVQTVTGNPEELITKNADKVVALINDYLA